MDRTPDNGSAKAHSNVAVGASVRSTRQERTASSALLSKCVARLRVPFIALGLVFVLLVVLSVATMVLVLDPIIMDQSTDGVATATRGALVAVAERVARPFHVLQTYLKMHTADNVASGDTCADGRTTLQQSRRYITKYATSIETSVFPIWVAYHMFRVPRPSGETWTFCGCATTDAHGYEGFHCDSFNQTNLLVSPLGLPVRLEEVVTATDYNRTTATYLPPILKLREGADEDGMWSEPRPYVYPDGIRVVVTVTIHMPVQFRYNWEYDVDAVVAPPAAPFRVYTLREAPRPGLNASDPRLSLPGQPFEKKVSMTESAEVLLEGIKEVLDAAAPEHADVVLVHAATELLIATTYDIPVFDLQDDQSHKVWPARQTPNAVLNAVIAAVFDVQLKHDIERALESDRRVDHTHGHLGVSTPNVHVTEDWIVTAALMSPGHGFTLCLITVTEKAPYYESVTRARLLTFLIAGFVCVACLAAVLAIVALIHRPLSALRCGIAAAATLQLDSRILRRESMCVSVSEIADLQDSFAVMNDLLGVAGSYLPHGVRTEWLRRSVSTECGSATDPATALSASADVSTSSPEGPSARYLDEQPRRERTAMKEHRGVVPMKRAMNHQRHVAVLQVNVIGFHAMVSASDHGTSKHAANNDGVGAFLRPALDPASLRRGSSLRRGARYVVPFGSKELFLAEDMYDFLKHFTALVVRAATRHGGVLDSFQGDRFTVSFNAVTGVQFPEYRAFCCAAMLRQLTQASRIDEPLPLATHSSAVPALRDTVDVPGSGTARHAGVGPAPRPCDSLRGVSAVERFAMEQASPRSGDGGTTGSSDVDGAEAHSPSSSPAPQECSSGATPSRQLLAARSNGSPPPVSFSPGVVPPNVQIGGDGLATTEAPAAPEAPLAEGSRSVVSIPLSCGLSVGTAVVGSIGCNAMRRLGILGGVVGEAALLERLCRSYTDVRPTTAPAASAAQASHSFGIDHVGTAAQLRNLLSPAPPTSISQALLTATEPRPSADRSSLLRVDAGGVGARAGSLSLLVSETTGPPETMSLSGSSVEMRCAAPEGHATPSHGGDGGLSPASRSAADPLSRAVPPGALRAVTIVSTDPESSACDVEPRPTTDALWCAVSESAAVLLRRRGVPLCPVDVIALSGGAPSTVSTVVFDHVVEGGGHAGQLWENPVPLDSQWQHASPLPDDVPPAADDMQTSLGADVDSTVEGPLVSEALRVRFDRAVERHGLHDAAAAVFSRNVAALAEQEQRDQTVHVSGRPLGFLWGADDGGSFL